MPRLITLALLFSSASIAWGADWPQFRGADTTGVASDPNIPVAVGESIAWTADLPGRGLSGPIIVGDKVFLSASSGFAQDRLHLLCFDAKSGRPLWERQFWATGRTLCHPKMCNATPTPACDGERVFALFSSNDLACVDLDGNLQWFRGLTQDYQNASNSLGMSSSPIVVGETLIVQIENDSESLALGLDVATGENRWKLPRPVMVNWTSPVVLRGKTRADDLAVLQSGKGLVALRPYSGAEVWRFDEACSTIPSTTVGDGVLYAPSKGLTALQVDDAGGPPKPLWQQNRLGPITPSALIYEGRVFSIASSGVLNCAEIKNGNNLWSLRLTVQDGDKSSRGMFSATPVAAGGHVYCINEDGVVMVVDAKADKGQIVAHHDFGETVLGTPAIANGGLYLRSDKHLWKIARQ
ncbi:MAG: PQQ-binding-like beta-propeller repeat protein [Planctomycetales bacterium]